jgi:hypothetical protein
LINIDREILIFHKILKFRKSKILDGQYKLFQEIELNRFGSSSHFSGFVPTQPAKKPDQTNDAIKQFLAK